MNNEERLIEKNIELSEELHHMRKLFLEYQKQTGKPSEEEVWLSCYTAILSNSTYDFDSANIYATEACETYTRKFKQNSHSKPI